VTKKGWTNGYSYCRKGGERFNQLGRLIQNCRSVLREIFWRGMGAWEKPTHLTGEGEEKGGILNVHSTGPGFPQGGKSLDSDTGGEQLQSVGGGFRRQLSRNRKN